MQFTVSDHIFESEKERNLYYKFFAGYFLNELIPGIEERLSAFASLINSCSRRGLAASKQEISLSSTTTHVSFDNHTYLFGSISPDRGEFADILIQDKSSRTVIAIEAKVHSDWSFDKDINSNERRLKTLQDHMSGALFVPCLLVTRARWNECERRESLEYSNYKRFKDEPTCRTIVLLWEELVELVEDVAVKNFVNEQLARRKTGFGYGFSDNWFFRHRRS
jgi:hypothetical protein